MFRYFDTVNYSNTYATNILARLLITEKIKQYGSAYYRYTIKEGERPDHVAFDYYGDPTLVWLVFLSNQIVDPYFDWPMTQEQFNHHLLELYGSNQQALDKILYYRVNWHGDESTKTIAGYEALPSYLKKYWAPVVRGQSSIVYYQRKELDWVSETNKIVQLTVTGNTSVDIGTFVRQDDTVAELTFANTTDIFVKNVEGEFANTTITMGNNSLTVEGTTVIKESFQAGEEVYWSPVNAYDHHFALNESNKYIRLIDKNYVEQIKSEVRSLFV